MANTQASAKAKTKSPLAVVGIVIFAIVVVITLALFALTHLGGRKVSVGEEFPVGLLDTANIDGKVLRLIDASSSSRCLEDVQCVWAGEQEALLMYGFRFFTVKTVSQPEVQISPKYKIVVTRGQLGTIDDFVFVLKNAEE